MNDGLMRTNDAFVRMNDLRDTWQVSWLMRMSDALVRMNDAFMRMNAALVRMNDALVCTKGGHRRGFRPTEKHPSAAKAGLILQFIRHS